jgi:hypothetical protein
MINKNDVFVIDLARWYADGLSLSEISKKIGVSTTTVFRMFAKNSIATDPKRRKTTEGSRIIHNGYIFVKVRNHPFANYGGYVREHRLIMEKALNRLLRPWEIVHHKDGNTINNVFSNLELSEDSPHKANHAKKRSRNAEGKFIRSTKLDKLERR